MSKDLFLYKRVF